MSPEQSNNEHKAADLETIVVDREDVIEMMRRNERDRDKKTSHSLRITPPFDGEVRAKHHTSHQGNRYPPEVSVKPIHLGASVFLAGSTLPYHPDFPGTCRYPHRHDERARFRDQFGYKRDDGSYRELTEEEEEEWNEWWSNVIEVWENEVRRNLKDEATLESQTMDGMVQTTVEIRYETDG